MSHPNPAMTGMAPAPVTAEEPPRMNGAAIFHPEPTRDSTLP